MQGMHSHRYLSQVVAVGSLFVALMGTVSAQEFKKKDLVIERPHAMATAPPMWVPWFCCWQGASRVGSPGISVWCWPHVSPRVWRPGWCSPFPP